MFIAVIIYYNKIAQQSMRFLPKEELMNEVITSDVYEGCFYLLAGCELLAIEGQQVNGNINCKMRFAGELIAELQAQYFRGEAKINLFQFRRTYTRLCAWMNQAKKQLKHQLAHPADNQSRLHEGGAQ